jgi:hypothetical protein
VPLLYLLDENLRGLLWRYVVRHNARRLDPLDVVRVGDPADLPLGSDDPTVIRWCEANGRILVSHDQNTLIGHLANHLASGGRSSGIFIVRDAPVPDVVAYLAAAAYGSDPDEWRDGVFFIP